MNIDYEINIKPSGVSIRTRPQQTLFDAEGNEVAVPGQNHRRAVAVSSFETPEQFCEHINMLMCDRFGQNLTDIVTGWAQEKEQHELTSAQLLEVCERHDALCRQHTTLKNSCEDLLGKYGGLGNSYSELQDKHEQLEMIHETMCKDHALLCKKYEALLLKIEPPTSGDNSTGDKIDINSDDSKVNRAV